LLGPENTESPETRAKNKYIAEFVEMAVERAKDYGIPPASI
jgi:hypothetical protein